MSKTLNGGLALLLVLALLAVPLRFPISAEGETDPEPSPSPSPVTVTLSAGTLTVPYETSAELTAGVVGAPDTAEIVWTSSDTGIATVEPNAADSRYATVTAVNAGIVKVTASCEGGSASCTVTVPIQTVSIGTSAIMLDPAATYALRVTVAPSGASRESQAVTWSSTSPEVATVTNGVIFAVAPGTTNVTATAVVGGARSGVCAVTVSGIALSESSRQLILNTSVRLEKTAFGSAQNIQDWEWRSSNTAICRVDPTTGTVTGLEEGNATITCLSADERYSASCEITVVRNEAATIRYTLDGGALCFESLIPSIREASRNLTGNNGAASELSYITGLSVRTSQGTLYEGYVAEADTGSGVAGTYRYYDTASGRRIGNVYFVPKSGFSGVASISYTGYSVGGSYFTGEIIVTVRQSATTLAYSTHEGEPVRFVADDFSYYSQTATGRALRYVTFTLPRAQVGTLRYNRIDGELYEGVVEASDRYYRSGTPALDDVYFVPRAGYTGFFDLGFTGCDSAGTTFTGSVRITVTGLEGFDSSEIGYNVSSGQRVTFNANDFSEASYTATGTQLNYIRFTALPDSSRGVLYYGSGTGTRVTTGTFYYFSAVNNSTRLIRNLAFAASSAYQGTFTLPFIGVNNWNESFSGTIRITVTPDVDTEVSYSITNSQTLHILPADFSRASYAVTGEDFSHLYFNGLPASAQGTLLLAGTPVTSTSGSYYRSGSARLLETVSFTPAGSYSGVVMLPYTAYTSSGKSFDGMLTISVSTSSASSGALSYFTTGPAVKFHTADFVSAVSDQLSGTLSTVRFVLPDSSVGRLCFNYVSPTDYSLVSGSAAYASSSLGQIAFQPRAGYRGTIHIAYTATNTWGGTFTGTIQIQVAPPSVSTRFSDMGGYAWAVPAVDFLASAGILNGTAPNSYSPADPMRRGDFVLMLARAFSFGELPGSAFPDVSENAYYAPAVNAARQNGIVAGDERGNFNPSSPISRQEAAVLLYRSMRRSGSMPSGSFTDLAIFSDRGDVSNYAIESMGSLVRLGVFQGDGTGRLMPTANLTRAEMAALFYRAIT